MRDSSLVLVIAFAVGCANEPSNELLRSRTAPEPDDSTQSDAPEAPAPARSPSAPVPGDIGAPPGTMTPTDETSTAPGPTPEPKPAVTLAKNVAKAIAFGQALIGARYEWRYGGPLPSGAPMWTAPGAPPSPAAVVAGGVNCSGLVNLMLRAIGKPLPSDPVSGTGGTGAYGAYYAKVAKPFDVNAAYPPGTLIGRRYRDTVDQGHVAVVLASGRVLQSFAYVYGGTSPGVNATYTVAQSNGGGFYEYAVLPQDWLAP